MVAPEQDSRWVSQQPSGGLLKSLAYVPKWKFVKMLVPLTIAFLIAFLLVYRADFARERERLLSRERSVIQSGVRRAEQGLEIAAGDLRFVSDLVTELADDREPDRLFVLERSLLALVQRRPGYLQIRFIGAAGLLTLFYYLFFRGLVAARSAQDRLGTYICLLVVAWLAGQMTINVGMVLGRLPTIGVPLPLISYGGSSLLAVVCGIALILSVRSRRFVN